MYRKSLIEMIQLLHQKEEMQFRISEEKKQLMLI